MGLVAALLLLMFFLCASLILTCANSVVKPESCCPDLALQTNPKAVRPVVCVVAWLPHYLHAPASLLSSLTSGISAPSPARSPSELIIAPPPPWPFSCCESSAPQQPSTSVVAAFITLKQANVEADNALKKPANQTPGLSGGLVAEKPPLAQPEPDFDDIIFESLSQTQESGGLFLEEEDSKTDTIKRCPPG